MKEQDVPVTTAVRALRAAGVSFTPHLYDYAEHGGTRQVAQVFGVDEHMVVKTLVMEAQEAGRKKHILVLMHGDREVSTKQLARFLDVKAVSPASVAEVEKSTGYVPGGVSPFGTRTPLSVYAEETILDLEKIYINGGKRGLQVEISPRELVRVLGAVPVRVAVEKRG